MGDYQPASGHVQRDDRLGASVKTNRRFRLEAYYAIHARLVLTTNG